MSVFSPAINNIKQLNILHVDTLNDLTMKDEVFCLGYDLNKMSRITNPYLNMISSFNDSSFMKQAVLQNLRLSKHYMSANSYRQF